MSQDDIFISYSRQDATYVERIVEILRSRGLEVFFDQDILVGESWLPKLQNAMEKSRATVFFMTQSYLKSNWAVLEQYGALILANNKKHLLMPVLLEGTTVEMLPLFLKTFQCLNCSDYSLSDVNKREEIGKKLAGAIKRLLPDIGLPTLDMPFVVLAMTKPEANELLDMKASEQLSPEVIQHLTANFSREQLVAPYGDTRDEWRSPLCRSDNEDGITVQTTIQETIEDVVNRLNKAVLDETGRQYEEPNRPILRPEYFSADFTSENFKTRNRTYNDLSKRGCVLVVDFLSLCHPKLRTCLNNSGLAQPHSKTVPIIVPLPEQRIDELDVLLEDAMKEVMERAFYRYETELDILSEFGINHPRALKRWLFFVLPLAASNIQRQRANPENRQRFLDQLHV